MNLKQGTITINKRNGLSIGASIERWGGIKGWSKAILLVPRSIFDKMISSLPGQEGALFPTNNTFFGVLPFDSLKDEIIALNMSIMAKASGHRPNNAEAKHFRIKYAELND